MAYKVYSLLCRNHDHGEMDYKGEGDFECPVCGFTYHDDDYDDDGSSERLGIPTPPIKEHPQARLRYIRTYNPRPYRETSK